MSMKLLVQIISGHFAGRIYQKCFTFFLGAFRISETTRQYDLVFSSISRSFLFSLRPVRRCEKQEKRKSECHNWIRQKYDTIWRNLLSKWAHKEWRKYFILFSLRFLFLFSNEEHHSLVSTCGVKWQTKEINLFIFCLANLSFLCWVSPCYFILFSILTHCVHIALSVHCQKLSPVQFSDHISDRLNFQTTHSNDKCIG